MNASRLALGGAPSSNTPMRGVAVLLCAWATFPATTSMKTMTKSPSHLTVEIADFRLPEKKFGGTRFIRLCSYLSIQNLAKMLLDDFIRSRQHIRRNCQTDLLSGYEINHELKLGWLRQRQFLGFSAF